MLSFLLFGDGCCACAGLGRTDRDRARAVPARRCIPRSEELITWHIGDSGFEMHLSGQVPGRIRRWLREHGAALLGERAARTRCGRCMPAADRSWMPCSRRWRSRPMRCVISRDVLRDFGNMSSATLMFVLDRILRDRAARGDGMAMAFGPGLTVETFAFHRPDP